MGRPFNFSYKSTFFRRCRIMLIDECETYMTFPDLYDKHLEGTFQEWLFGHEHINNVCELVGARFFKTPPPNIRARTAEFVRKKEWKQDRVYEILQVNPKTLEETGCFLKRIRGILETESRWLPDNYVLGY